MSVLYKCMYECLFGNQIPTSRSKSVGGDHEVARAGRHPMLQVPNGGAFDHACHPPQLRTWNYINIEGL